MGLDRHRNTAGALAAATLDVVGALSRRQRPIVQRRRFGWSRGQPQPPSGSEVKNLLCLAAAATLLQVAATPKRLRGLLTMSQNTAIFAQSNPGAGVSDSGSAYSNPALFEQRKTEWLACIASRPRDVADQSKSLGRLRSNCAFSTRRGGRHPTALLPSSRRPIHGPPCRSRERRVRPGRSSPRRALRARVYTHLTVALSLAPSSASATSPRKLGEGGMGAVDGFC